MAAADAAAADAAAAPVATADSSPDGGGGEDLARPLAGLVAGLVRGDLALRLAALAAARGRSYDVPFARDIRASVRAVLMTRSTERFLFGVFRQTTDWSPGDVRVDVAVSPDPHGPAASAAGAPPPRVLAPPLARPPAEPAERGLFAIDLTGGRSMIVHAVDAGRAEVLADA